GKPDKAGILLALRHFKDRVGLPKLSKGRQGHAVRRAAFSGNVVERFQPLEVRFTFSKALASTRLPALAEIGEHLKIIAGFITRRDNALHRHHVLITVITGHGEIVTLERRGGG